MFVNYVDLFSATPTPSVDNPRSPHPTGEVVYERPLTNKDPYIYGYRQGLDIGQGALYPNISQTALFYKRAK